MSKRLDQLRERVSRLCDRTDVPEPGEFLASLMSGSDPRRRDPLLRSLVLAVVRESGGDQSIPPNSEDWSEIVSLVLDSGLYETEPVPLEVSTAAARELLQYLEAKLKAVEVSGDLDVNLRVVPLTDDEIKRFKGIWDGQF